MRPCSWLAVAAQGLARQRAPTSIEPYDPLARLKALRRADCGGPCDGCITRSFCYTGHDCQSGHCLGSGPTRQCAPNRCDDALSNGDETDTDCGGNCFGKCPDGYRCSQGFECESNRCLGNDKFNNQRYCAPVRLFNVPGNVQFSSIVRGGFDIRGKHKAALVDSVFKRALATFFDLTIPQVSTDSLTDVQGARSFGERSPNVTLLLDENGLEISKTTDTVDAARFRFELYVLPYEVELYEERVRWLEQAFMDVDAAGNTVRRGIQRADTLFQAGDADKFKDDAPLSSRRALTTGGRSVLSTNGTSGSGTLLPDTKGWRRLFLNDVLQREGINNTGVVNVDPAETAGAAASRLFVPHHLVIEQQPNRSEAEAIENSEEFPVQPIVYVADRHNRRIRLYQETAYIAVQLDEEKFPPGTPNELGEFTELFGDRIIELTYINDGKAFFSDLSISAPIPDGATLRFSFVSDDEAFQTLSIPVVESIELVVSRAYVPPKVVVPRVPFPPALVVAMCFITVVAVIGTAHFGLKWYRTRKQERHVVPSKAPPGMAKAGHGGLAFGDEEGMTGHVDELARGYIDPEEAAKAAAAAAVRTDSSEGFDQETGLRRSKSWYFRQAKDLGGQRAQDDVASTKAAVSRLGNADAARAFDLLEMEMGKPTAVSKLPEAMQRLHKHGMLNIPNIVEDEPDQKGGAGRIGSKRMSWRPSWFDGLSRIMSGSLSPKRSGAGEPDAKDAARGDDGLAEVEVVSAGPEAAPAEAFMSRPAARTVGESLHMANRKFRRSSSVMASSLGLAGTAAKLFPKEETRAYLSGQSPEEVLQQQVAEEQARKRAAGSEDDGEAAIEDAVGLDGAGTAEGEAV